MHSIISIFGKISYWVHIILFLTWVHLYSETIANTVGIWSSGFMLYFFLTLHICLVSFFLFIDRFISFLFSTLVSQSWIPSRIYSLIQSCWALWDLMQHTRHPCLLASQELAQIHVHWVGDAIQPFHPRLSPSPPAINFSQCQGLFQWVSSLQQVAKILEVQF